MQNLVKKENLMRKNPTKNNSAVLICVRKRTLFHKTHLMMTKYHKLNHKHRARIMIRQETVLGITLSLEMILVKPHT